MKDPDSLLYEYLQACADLLHAQSVKDKFKCKQYLVITTILFFAVACIVFAVVDRLSFWDLSIIILPLLFLGAPLPFEAHSSYSHNKSNALEIEGILSKWQRKYSDERITAEIHILRKEAESILKKYE